MTAMFINIIPEFRHDQAVQRLMVASTSSNLSAVVDMLMLGIPWKTSAYRRPPPSTPAGSPNMICRWRPAVGYYQTERQRWEKRSDATRTGFRISHAEAPRARQVAEIGARRHAGQVWATATRACR